MRENRMRLDNEMINLSKKRFVENLCVSCTFPPIEDTLFPMLEWFQNLLKRETPKDALGDRGENMAARHLRNKGYKIILRNFRCELGEIDIIARQGKTLVFVEVKTRAYDDPTPEEQVNVTKQQQILKAAKYYLTRYGVPQPPARFDVIAIIWPTGQPPIIRHTEHAFQA